MTLRRALATLALCLLPVVPATVVTSGPASAVSDCAAGGLRFTTVEDGVTYSVKVTRVRVSGETCATARALATKVARADLGSRIPRRVGDFRLTVTEPCPGCTPKTHVLAVGANGATTIRFDLRGGA